MPRSRCRRFAICPVHLPLSDPGCRPLYPRFQARPRPPAHKSGHPGGEVAHSLGGHRKKAVLDAKGGREEGGELLRCTSLFFRRPPIFFSPSVQVWYLNPLLSPIGRARKNGPELCGRSLPFLGASVLQTIRVERDNLQQREIK